MIYNDRVTIIKDVLGEGFLGDDVIEEKNFIVPCQRGRLTNNEQIGIFGSYNLSAFKLHIQGIHKDIKELEYEGIRRSVHCYMIHRNTTVVIVQ